MPVFRRTVCEQPLMPVDCLVFRRMQTITQCDMIKYQFNGYSADLIKCNLIFLNLNKLTHVSS